MGNVRQGFLYADKAESGPVASLLGRAGLGPGGGLLSTQWPYAVKASGGATAPVSLRATGPVAAASGHITRARFYAEKASAGPSAELFSRCTPTRYASVWKILPGTGVAWAFDTGDTARHVIVSGGYVYVCGDNGVWKLNASTGALVWKSAAVTSGAHRVRATTPGLCVVTSSDQGKSIWMLDPADGSEIWSAYCTPNAYDVCEGPSGKLHVVGTRTIDANLWRFGADGTPELSTEASWYVDINGYDYAPTTYAVCVSPDGSICTMSQVETDVPGGSHQYANGRAVDPTTYAYVGIGHADRWHNQIANSQEPVDPLGERFAIQAYGGTMYMAGYFFAPVISTPLQSGAASFSFGYGTAYDLHVNSGGLLAGVTGTWPGYSPLWIMQTDPALDGLWHFYLPVNVYGVHLEDGGLGTGHVYAAGARCDDWTDYAGVTL